MLTGPLPSPEYSEPELTPGAPLTPGGLNYGVCRYAAEWPVWLITEVR